jgi:hypothetical protein
METVENKDLKIKVIPNLVTEEDIELKRVRDHLFQLKAKYDSVTLSKNIAALKAVSRMQHIPDSLRSECLRELRKQEMIKQILDGEYA